MKKIVWAAVAALISGLFAGGPVTALNSQTCSQNTKDFRFAGFSYLCDVELAPSSLSSDPRKLVYRPDTGDYVFVAKNDSGVTGYVTSLTPESTYPLTEVVRASSLVDLDLHYLRSGGENVISFSRFNSSQASALVVTGQTQDLVPYSGGRHYSDALNSDVFYHQFTDSGYWAELPGGQRFSVANGLQNLPQIALRDLAGSSFEAYVNSAGINGDKIFRHFYSSPTTAYAGGTEIVAFPLSERILAVGHDGTNILAVSKDANSIHLNTVSLDGNISRLSSIPAFTYYTNMVVVPTGVYFEVATDVSLSSRRLYFMPRSASKPIANVVNDREWTVSATGKAAWVEQAASGGYYIREYDPATFLIRNFNKLPFPAMQKPTINYVANDQFFVSVAGLGSFVGRPTATSATPAIDVNSLMSWYEPGENLVLTGTDLQTVVDLDCTSFGTTCQVVMNPDTDKYEIHYDLSNASPGNASLSLQFQESPIRKVTKSFTYSVRNPITANLVANGITPGQTIQVSGTSLDLVSNVTFGPSTEFVNPNVQVQQGAGLISLPTETDLAPGSYTLKLFHPDKRGASYPLQSISLAVTVGAVIAPVFESLTNGADVEVGSTVTINGQNLRLVENVFVNGVPVTGLLIGSTQIRFSFPDLPAGSHPITASVDGEIVETGLSLSVAVVPQVQTVDGPAEAYASDVFTLNGTSLGLVTSLRLGNKSVPIRSRTGTRLTFAVPADLASGSYPISFGWSGGVIETEFSVVVGELPVVTSATGHDRATPGSTVQLVGENLAEIRQIKLGDRLVADLITTDTTLSFQVPEDMALGNYEMVLLGAREVAVPFVLTVVDPSELLPLVTSAIGHDRATPGLSVLLVGERLADVEQIRVGDQVFDDLTTTETTLSFQLPADFALGSYVMVLLGDREVEVPFVLTVVDPSELIPEVDLTFKVWTKRISATEIKMYAKNPVDAGKVVMRVNGREIAWVRALTVDDPKLRLIRTGPMAGTSYLVRTVVLKPGRNVLEFYVDGERIRRNIYSPEG